MFALPAHLKLPVSRVTDIKAIRSGSTEPSELGDRKPVIQGRRNVCVTLSVQRNPRPTFYSRFKLTASLAKRPQQTGAVAGAAIPHRTQSAVIIRWMKSSSVGNVGSN